MQNLWMIDHNMLTVVVPEEESAKRMLHTPTHLHQVPQDVPLAALISLDVHQTHCDQQISTHSTKVLESPPYTIHNIFQI